MDELSRAVECSRCHAPFECRAADIQNCQCNTVTLNDQERAYINDRFKDCLCVPCMLELKAEFQETLPQ